METSEKYRPLCAGDLDQRVTLHQATAAKDATYGGISRSFASVGDRWAAFVPLAESETIVGDKVEAIADVMIHLRYDSVTAALVAADRVILGSRTFEIVGSPSSVSGRKEQIAFRVREVR